MNDLEKVMSDYRFRYGFGLAIALMLVIEVAFENTGVIINTQGSTHYIGQWFTNIIGLVAAVIVVVLSYFTWKQAKVDE